MRRWLPNLIALSIVLAGYSYLRWSGPAPAEEAAAPDLVRLIDEFDVARVEQLSVQSQDYTATFSPTAVEGKWTAVISPGTIPASLEPDQNRIDALVYSLRYLYAGRKVVQQPDNLATWGLDQPNWILALKFKEGGTATLRVGNHQPINNTYYAMRDGDPSVYTISDTLAASLPQAPPGWFLTAAPPDTAPAP